MTKSLRFPVFVCLLTWLRVCVRVVESGQINQIINKVDKYKKNIYTNIQTKFHSIDSELKERMRGWEIHKLFDCKML